ncbi:MAG: hypothetical protein LBV75_01545 [Paludibacter sp.]|jgi:hypothetical protein|nr:hypothetical protein [Paludibacter sp.]
MKKVYFRYKEHPGDFYRDTSFIELPEPEKYLENFWIQFLYCYQNDDRVACLDDLYKWLHKEFSDKEQEKKFIEQFGNKTIEEIKTEINTIENELTEESYHNFYHLIFENKIEIIVKDE